MSEHPGRGNFSVSVDQVDEITLLVVGLRWLFQYAWQRWNAPTDASTTQLKSVRSVRAARRRMVELRRNMTLANSEEDTAGACNHVHTSTFRQWAQTQDRKRENAALRADECGGAEAAADDSAKGGSEHGMLTPVLAVSGEQDEEDGWDSDDEGGDDEDVAEGSWLTDRYINDDTHQSRGEFGPYSTYTPEDWAEDVKAKWLRMNRQVNKELLRLLECGVRQSANPLLTVLIIARSSHRQRPNGPHCVARHALEIYQKVYPAPDSCSASGPLSSQASATKPPSIPIGTTQNALEVAALVTSPQVLELLVEVFALRSSSLSLAFVETLIGDRRYRDAATLAEELHLQNRLPVEKITTPLFIAGQGGVAEMFVGEDVSLQKRAVAALDRLLAPESDLVIKCSEMGIKKPQLQEKAIEKLVERLIKLYRLNPVDFPNFVDGKNLSVVRNLLYRMYTTDAEGSWNELIEASVRGNLYLQVGLVEALVLDYKDHSAAAYWAKRFAVPPGTLSESVLNRVDALCHTHYLPEIDDGMSLFSLTDDPISATYGHTEYYSLELSDNRISMVDDDLSLRHCMDHVLKPGTVVGMDSEWRPLLSTGGNARMGLLQLATRSHAFLLDMVALPKPSNQKLLCKLLVELFTSKAVVLLGYGFDGDVEMLMNTIPSIREAIRPLRRVIDLRTLSEQVDHAEGRLPVNWRREAEIPVSSDGFQTIQAEKDEKDEPVKYKHYTSGAGLAGLVEVCFGLPLDKRQQMSDWERRPLRPQQKVYAALDAYCLVQVYTVLQSRARQLGINPEPWMELRNWEKARRSARLKHEQFAIDDTQDHSGSVVRPQEFRIVMDAPLQGLGRYLRCCGVDVVLPPTDAERSSVAAISCGEERCLVTSGLPYMRYRQEVAHGRIFAVPAGRVREQVVEVLRHFNVAVLPEDLFSRCQACNSCQYRRISGHGMRQVQDALQSGAAGNGDHTASSSSQNGGENGHSPAAAITSTNGHAASIPTASSAGVQNGTHTRLSKASAPPPSANGGHLASNGCNGHSNGHHIAGKESRDRKQPISPSEVPFISLAKGIVISGRRALVTQTSVELQLENVTSASPEQVDSFVCCCGCGKVFWETQRSQDVRKQFQLVLDHCSPDSY